MKEGSAACALSVFCIFSYIYIFCKTARHSLPLGPWLLLCLVMKEKQMCTYLKSIRPTYSLMSKPFADKYWYIYVRLHKRVISGFLAHWKQMIAKTWQPDKQQCNYMNFIHFKVYSLAESRTVPLALCHSFTLTGHENKLASDQTFLIRQFLQKDSSNSDLQTEQTLAISLITQLVCKYMQLLGLPLRHTD